MGVKEEEGQDEVMPERRQRTAHAGSVSGMEKKKIPKAHQIPSAPAGETEHPDVKETIYRSISSCQYLNDIHLSG